MILYIHGFASSGLGAKARLVREHWGKEALAPSLSFIPDLAVDTLEQIVEHSLDRGEAVGLIGSSLGGFYALWLSERYRTPAVLVNPAVRPWETLSAQHLEAVSFYDCSAFSWEPRHVESLRRYRVERPGDPSLLLLMLQTGDEILDYRIALGQVKGAELLLEEGGDHGFKGFERQLGRIEEFFERRKLQ
ncbi:YqiA/YcfP family alpha/beta fold hydrolase [Nitratifractor sp.]